MREIGKCTFYRPWNIRSFLDAAIINEVGTRVQWACMPCTPVRSSFSGAPRSLSLQLQPRPTPTTSNFTFHFKIPNRNHPNARQRPPGPSPKKHTIFTIAKVSLQRENKLEFLLIILEQRNPSNVHKLYCAG